MGCFLVYSCYTSSEFGHLWNGQCDFAEDIGLKPEINRRADDVLMSHEVANRFDPDLAGEKAHGEGVTQDIGEIVRDRQSALAHTVLEKLSHAGL